MSAPATCDFDDISHVLRASRDESDTVLGMPPTRRDPASGEPQGRKHPTSRSPKYAPKGEVPDNAFARLVMNRKEELELSWYDIAKAGGFRSHTIAYALARKTEWKQPPRPETLKRLAKALRLPLDVVKSAAAEACGYNLAEISVPLARAETAKIIVAGLSEMTDEEADQLRALFIQLEAEIQGKRKKRKKG